MSRVNRYTAYISKMAASRPVYIELVKRALDLLPPPGVGTGVERLVCFDSMAKLAKALGIGRTTVRGDLERLLNYGWLQITDDDGYLLGRREAGELYLLSDLAAEQALGGKQKVVSKLVLRDVLPKPSSPPEQTDSSPVRGAGRQWRPDA